jgi:hypothetical protein
MGGDGIAIVPKVPCTEDEVSVGLEDPEDLRRHGEGISQVLHHPIR